MPTIITNSQLQRNPSSIRKGLEKNACIVTAHGRPKMIILPYFENSDEWIEDYYEDLEIERNREKLKKELKESDESGLSDFEL